MSADTWSTYKSQKSHVTPQVACRHVELMAIFDKLSESERENEKDKADIIAQKKKLNELDITEVFKEF